MLKSLCIPALLLGFAVGMPAAQADAPEPDNIRLAELVKTEPQLADDYKQLMAPLADDSPWVLNYGTTAPASIENLDGKEFYVFWGCKPHDCITESYVLLANVETMRITAGAFLENEYKGPNLAESEITWVGETTYDAGRVVGRYLY